MESSIKRHIRRLIAATTVTAAVTFAHEAKASHDIDSASFNPKLKDATELVMNNSLSGQEEISQAEQGQSHVFLEKIKKGEKIEYNGMSFDTKKLNASKNKDLKNFGFVFENGQVGIKIFNDGKKLFGKDDPSKTYKILMSEEDFEGLMNMLMDKDQNKTSSVDFDVPPEYKDPYPHFYVNGVEGMSAEDAGKAFDGLLKAVLAMNSEGVLDGSKIIKKNEDLINKADYGWILVKAANAPTIVQNALLSEGLGNYKESFVNMASNVDVLRVAAEKDFKVKQEVAALRAEKAAQRASAPVVTESDRLDQILIVDHIGKPVIDTKDGVHLSFTCEGGRFDIHTNNQKITDSSVSFAGYKRVLPIQPEEWKMISNSLDRLPEKTKKELGPQFLKLVKEKSTQQTVSPTLLASASASR